MKHTNTNERLDSINITIDEHNTVICKDAATGGFLKSQSVQTILLCKILQRLDEIRNNTISICRKNTSV